VNKSENINELAAALSKAQAEIEGAKADSANPFFKSNYADLHSVKEALRAPFAKNGLSVTQLLSETDTGTHLLTVLMHSSGQWVESSVRVRSTKDDPQGFMAGLTYARRGSLAAIALVPQMDDDGNEATGKPKEPPAAKQEEPKTPPPVKPPGVATNGGPTQAQINRLWTIANKTGWDNKGVHDFILKRYKIDSVKKLTRPNYDFLCDVIMPQSKPGEE